MRARSGLIVLMITALAVVPTAILFLIFESWYHLWPMSLASAASIGIIISGIVGCLTIYNLHVERIPTEMSADDTLRRTEFHLRGIGHPIERNDRRLVVRLDQNRTAKIRVRENGQGSVLEVSPGLTPSGIALTFFLCVVLPFCGIGALWMAFGSYQRTTSLCSETLRPTIEYLENQKEDPTMVMGADLKLVMIDTLNNASQLAKGALAALKSSYEDSSWLAVALVMLAYVVIALGTENLFPGTLSNNPILVLLSLLLTLAGTIALIWRFRVRYQQRSNDLRMKIRDIWSAIYREQGTLPITEQDESSLGTILRIWPAMPIWVRYQRKNFYNRNPLTSVIVAAMLLLSWQTVRIGDWGFLVSLVLAGASVGLYLWTKRKNVRDDSKMLAEWNEKVQSLMSKIDPELRGL